MTYGNTYETLYETYLKCQPNNGWYQAMFISCADIALESDIPLHTVIGVVAATSPRASVSANLLMARRACVNNDVRCLFADKVRSLIRGEAWEDVLGMKTLDFAYAIQTKGIHDRAPMDIWAARAAGFKGEWKPTVKKYEELLDNYVLLAHNVGRPVAIVQADVWVQARGSAW